MLVHIGGAVGCYDGYELNLAISVFTQSCGRPSEVQ